jgi:hypothetical protein
MEVSRKGEVGVFVGLVVGLVNYRGDVVERKLRELDRSQTRRSARRSSAWPNRSRRRE